MRLLVICIALCLTSGAFAALPSLAKWSSWYRDSASGSAAAVDPQVQHGTGPVVRVDHRGKQDWAYFPGLDVPVKQGDVLEMAADIKLSGEGDAGPCLTMMAEPGKAVDWVAGFRPAVGTTDWETLRARIVVPAGVTIVQPRIIGNRAATIWIANPTLTRKGNIMAGSNLPRTPPSISNDTITIDYDPAKTTFTVRDRRDGMIWKQLAPRDALMPVSATVKEGSIEADLLDVNDELKLRMAVTIDKARPEFVVTLTGEGEMTRSLSYPGAFAMAKGQYLVVPMNEGIAYPAEDEAILPWGFIAYGGHGICMPFFGATDGTRGWMAILQTPDDATLQLGRSDGLNWGAPVWDPQRGQFGYKREIRYVVFDKGGHVAMAKRYREYAKAAGLLKTFAEKRKERPAIDKLLGAVNTWCWDQNAAPIAREMQQAGIDRILWSNQLKPEQIELLNDMGVLTSRYDIYQDLMDPANFSKIRYTHPHWTTEGFPKDIILEKNGKPIRGWEIEEKNGSGMIPCAVLCDLKAPEYAMKRIGEELKTHPYQCRFIDTTTAAPWRECYSPDHPMTRTQSREAKMKLLAVVSDQYKLVCGSETGHDAAVPYCDYFEGMLSLGPYRLDDAGRNMSRIDMNVPEKLSTFQVGERYRLPLWELVYHDCCVAQWYWGDYNNKLPPIWKKRDLFNALYGTPPMLMFTRKQWDEQKARFVESYKTSAAITRATADSEMTDHVFLTADRSVQQTVFANGVKVTVSFGDKEYSSGGITVVPGAVHVEGIK